MSYSRHQLRPQSYDPWEERARAFRVDQKREPAPRQEEKEPRAPRRLASKPSSFPSVPINMMAYAQSHKSPTGPTRSRYIALAALGDNLSDERYVKAVVADFYSRLEELIPGSVVEISVNMHTEPRVFELPVVRDPTTVWIPGTYSNPEVPFPIADYETCLLVKFNTEENAAVALDALCGLVYENRVVIGGFIGEEEYQRVLTM